MAWILDSPKSALVLGMPGTFTNVIACGNVAPNSGFAELRYLVYQLGSTVRFMRLVSRPIFWAPAAWLLGKVRNRSRFSAGAPLDSRYAIRKVAWLSSSRVLLEMYCGPSGSSCIMAF